MTFATQLTSLVTFGGRADARATQFGALVAFAPQATFSTNASSVVALVSEEGQDVPRMSQAVMLVAFRTGPRENLEVTAWTFEFDGHTFYVLNLGDAGTYVYDITTGQWSQFQTEGLNGWNMINGISWRGETIGADEQNPLIYQMNPLSFEDDGYKRIKRTVTGGLSVRQRTFIPVYAFRITGSVGEPSMTDATINLRYSDDQGRTYIDAGSLTIEAGANEQELLWTSLGLIQSPQRIFEVSDFGGLARINGADAEIGEE